MKKYCVICVSLVFLLCVLLVCFLLSDWNIDPYLRERKILADELGVNINKYRPIDVFPSNYFFEVLESGMSSEEVHQIVKGYEAVFICDWNLEYYYFFSSDSDKAVRFIISYDDKGKFEFFDSEGDERYLHYFVDGCVPGRFGE